MVADEVYNVVVQLWIDSFWAGENKKSMANKLLRFQLGIQKQIQELADNLDTTIRVASIKAQLAKIERDMFWDAFDIHDKNQDMIRILFPQFEFSRAE